MEWPKLISLTRLWYSLIVIFIHLILVYVGLKQHYFYDNLSQSSSSTLKFELIVEKFLLILSIVILPLFVYSAIFRIGNFANDEQTLSINHLRSQSCTSWRSLWAHSYSLSSSTHLLMSFLVLIAPILVQSKQIMMTFKDPEFLRRTDLDLLFDWSSSPMISINKRLIQSNLTTSSLSFPIDNYSRWCLLNFLLASTICVVREPSVFWSLSKIFSLIYSLGMAVNVIQWCLMYGALQLLLKNVSFNMIDSRYTVGYLLSNQPYATFFLYLLLEFLVFISSMTFYYYAYVRFRSNDQTSSYDRCSNYCPSLIAIIILLLYTACKMPLVHDIFLLYIQTRIRLLLLTFAFEIFHVLTLLIIWIFLTTKSRWFIEEEDEEENDGSSKRRLFDEATTKSKPIESLPLQPIATLSMPDLNRTSSSKERLNEKPYEKIRIFQSEIYYQNRPKNWSLPLNQQARMVAAFDTDDDIVLRSSSATKQRKSENCSRSNPRKTNEINIYQCPKIHDEQETNAVFYRTNTPPVPPVKRFTKEQVEAARKRAEQMFLEQQKSAEFLPHRHSAALLISQV